MLYPGAVQAACTESTQLKSLTSQVFQPLEKSRAGVDPEVEAFDAAIDASSATLAIELAHATRAAAGTRAERPGPDGRREGRRSRRC
jgi:hypothetical protein